MSHLKDRNRGLILLLLDKVEGTNDRKYIPVLKAWEQIDYRKVQSRIRQVIHLLNRSATQEGAPADGLSHGEWAAAEYGKLSGESDPA